MYPGTVPVMLATVYVRTVTVSLRTAHTKLNCFHLQPGYTSIKQVNCLLFCNYVVLYVFFVTSFNQSSHNNKSKSMNLWSLTFLTLPHVLDF